MKRDSRFFAAVELSWLFLLWYLTTWVAWVYSGASVWTAAGMLGLVLTVLCSAVIRRPGWKNSGFRLDNFWPALIYVGFITLCALALFLAFSKIAQFSFSPLSGRTMVRFLVSGLLQQAFFLGYLFHRWDALFQNPRGAAIANALSFAFIHLPYLLLVATTALGGLLLGGLFVRFRNVFVLGLAHGVLALFTVPVLYHAGIVKTMRIGPPVLGPLVEKINHELGPKDRIGICSQTLVPRQFGHRFDRPIERIGYGLDDNDLSLREHVKSFLTAKERVFCVLTERDFRRYMDPQLQRHLFILSKLHVWKHRLILDREFAIDFFRGPDDVPILAAFRDRVLLVSNRPSPRVVAAK